MANELYSTSVHKAAFTRSGGYHNGPLSLLKSLRNAQMKLASPRSFNTARLSLASYVTASSIPVSTTSLTYVRNYPTSKTPDDVSESGTTTVSDSDISEVVDAVVSGATLTILSRSDTGLPLTMADQKILKSWVSHSLMPWQDQGRLVSREATSINKVISRILEFLMSNGRQPLYAMKTGKRETLVADLTSLILPLLSRQCASSSAPPGQVFSSEWLNHLQSRGILLAPRDELDWSGRGQHVEYELKDATSIPLTPERMLGHSASTVVESVMCRRIRLARKRIRCHRRLKKEDAITEVEHLQRLQHSHIVRVVGTYTLKKDLAILLYPATHWNLDEFMDDLLLAPSLSNQPGNRALGEFFGCLSNAISFIHKGNVKHMDIKPQNLLVRPRGENIYKIYIADFGIARAYKSPEETWTDSPISFTRAYAAPEVVAQENRGFSADIFSLGCVFMEMLATMVSSTSENQRQLLLELRQSNPNDTSFQANINAVLRWYSQIPWKILGSGMTLLPSQFISLGPKMIEAAPDSRPTASKLNGSAASMCCPNCNDGPEPFEDAGAMSM